MRGSFAPLLILLAGCSGGGTWERPTWDDFIRANLFDGKTDQELQQDQARAAQQARDAEATYSRDLI